MAQKCQQSTAYNASFDIFWAKSDQLFNAKLILKFLEKQILGQFCCNIDYILTIFKEIPTLIAKQLFEQL